MTSAELWAQAQHMSQVSDTKLRQSNVVQTPGLKALLRDTANDFARKSEELAAQARRAEHEELQQLRDSQ